MITLVHGNETSKQKYSHELNNTVKLSLKLLFNERI